MAGRAEKDALFDAQAGVARALGSGRRAEIVDVLGQGERSVDHLAAELGQSVANTSQHLQHLLRAGLVRTRREGNHAFYCLASEQVSALWAAVREVAAQHGVALDQITTAYVGDRSGLDVVTRLELNRRITDGDVVVLDVRPEVEYQAGHIRGALSRPVTELARRLGDLPQDCEVIAYCRGPYCVFADDAVRALVGRGYRASRLEDGYPEWVRAGLPVDAPVG